MRASRTKPGRMTGPADRNRDEDRGAAGHARVHVPRAVSRRRDRRALRPVQLLRGPARGASPPRRPKLVCANRRAPRRGGRSRTTLRLDGRLACGAGRAAERACGDAPPRWVLRSRSPSSRAQAGGWRAAKGSCVRRRMIGSRARGRTTTSLIHAGRRSRRPFSPAAGSAPRRVGSDCRLSWTNTCALGARCTCRPAKRHTCAASNRRTSSTSACRASATTSIRCAR